MSDSSGAVTGLYQKHRPTSFKQVIGQDAAVAVLKGLLAGPTFPRALLFTGSPGTGKTSLARILQRKLGCDDADFFEVNCADVRGIDTVRDVRRRSGLTPIGEHRIWLFDEYQQQTPDAQEASLKLMEDTPPHVIFMLASTKPDKINKAIRTRCTEIVLRAVSAKLLAGLVLDVATKEGKPVSQDVADRIADHSEGSPRKALVLLESVLGINGEDERLGAISRSDQKAQAIELARLLMDGKTAWSQVAKVLGEVEEDPESLRHMVMGYAQSVLLGKSGQGPAGARAYRMLSVFRYPFYDSKKPGLVAACYEVCCLSKPS